MQLRFRETDRDIFDAIRKGIKTVETRAATEKYRRIAAGDEVTFVCGGSRFTRRVARMRKFRSVAALLRAYRPAQVNPRMKTSAEIRAMYDGFPGYPEKIRAYGIVAFEIARE